MEIIGNLLIALLFTLLVELVIAIFFGFKTKIDFIAIVLVNLITNPTLNYWLLLNRNFSLIEINLTSTLLLELIVILVEWKLLVFSLPRKSKRLLVLSLIMNVCSYTLGFLVLGSGR